jgi:hypothetical protein
MFTIEDSTLRLRRYDFSGKLWQQQTFQNSSAELFWSNGVHVKNNRIVMNSLEPGGFRMNYYTLNGKKIWTIDHNTHILNFQFTDHDTIFFSGVTDLDSARIGTDSIPREIFFGIMDTSGNILGVRNIPTLSYSGTLPFLSEEGRLYISGILTHSTTLGSSTYSIDTFSFNNLTYYDSATGNIEGNFYRLFAEFNLKDGLYSKPGDCVFSPTPDTCGDREGISNCSVITGITDLSQGLYFKIYPNPAHNTLYLDFSPNQFLNNNSIQITDLNGVLRRKWYNLGVRNSLNISDLTPGVYFIQLITLKRTAVRKLIVL